MFDRIVKAAHHERNDTDWAKTVFVDMGTTHVENEPGGVHIFAVEEALHDDPVGNTWYTCIPSIMYRWAPGTLQEAIGLRKRGDRWSIRKHLELVEQMCRGLKALHGKGMLHADMRPANIVYEGDPTDPKNYSLADYGSFAETTARPPDRQNISGVTIMGPVVGGERTSVFYAPERRAGRERETADTVVVVDPKDGSHIYLILGWREELVDKDTGKPRATVEELVKLYEPMEEDGKRVSNLLRAGDRIQMREYIFQLEGVECNRGNKRILKCNARSWKIYHGRIVIENPDSFSSPDWFPLSRTIELQQWSGSSRYYCGLARRA